MQIQVSLGTRRNFSIVLPVKFRDNINFCTRCQGVPKPPDLRCYTSSKLRGAILGQTSFEKQKEQIIQNFEQCRIHVKQIERHGEKGLLLEFPNGNILRISTEEKHHPLVYSYETRAEKEARLTQWYGEEENFKLDDWEDVDV